MPRAAKCPHCGEEHWSTMPCPSRGAPRASGLQEQLGVTPATKIVASATKTVATATKTVATPAAASGRESKQSNRALAEACAEIEQLRAEVKQLKQALAKAHLEGARPAALSGTERARKSRAKSKSGTNRLDFQG